MKYPAPAVEIAFDCFYVLVLGCIGFLLVKRKDPYSFTKVATYELAIALAFRVAFSAAYYFAGQSVGTLSASLRLEIPFYILIKVQFDMIFGWTSIQSCLEYILMDPTDAVEKIEQFERWIAALFSVMTSVFWGLVLTLLIVDLRKTTMSLAYYQTMYGLLVAFAGLALLCYIGVYITVRRTLQQLNTRAASQREQLLE